MVTLTLADIFLGRTMNTAREEIKQNQHRNLFHKARRVDEMFVISRKHHITPILKIIFSIQF